MDPGKSLKEVWQWKDKLSSEMVKMDIGKKIDHMKKGAKKIIEDADLKFRLKTNR